MLCLPLGILACYSWHTYLAMPMRVTFRRFFPERGGGAATKAELGGGREGGAANSPLSHFCQSVTITDGVQVSSQVKYTVSKQAMHRAQKARCALVLLQAQGACPHEQTWRVAQPGGTFIAFFPLCSRALPSSGSCGPCGPTL